MEGVGKKKKKLNCKSSLRIKTDIKPKYSKTKRFVGDLTQRKFHLSKKSVSVGVLSLAMNLSRTWNVLNAMFRFT